jgi:hypothetical protein
MQGGSTTNLLVEDNYFADFLDPNPGTFGLSVAVDGGRNTVVRNNTVIARPAATTATPWGTSYGIGIEIGGEAATLYGNYVAGLWHLGIAIGKAPHTVIRDNYLCGSPGAREIRQETNPPVAVTIEGNVRESECKSEKRGRGDNTGPRSRAILNAPPLLLEITGRDNALNCLAFGVSQGAIVNKNLGNIAREERAQITLTYEAGIGGGGNSGQFAARSQNFLTIDVERVRGAILDGRVESGARTYRSRAVVKWQVARLRGAEAERNGGLERTEVGDTPPGRFSPMDCGGIGTDIATLLVRPVVADEDNRHAG